MEQARLSRQQSLGAEPAGPAGPTGLILLRRSSSAFAAAGTQLVGGKPVAAGIQLAGCRPVAGDKQLVGYIPFAVVAEDS